MYQFSNYSYQVPYFIWNPCFLGFQNSIVPSGGQSIIQGSLTQIVSESQIRTQQLSFEEKLNMVIPKLECLHKETPGNKKTHWSQSEDQLLQNLVQKQKFEWKQIQKFFQGRTLSMCYSRYRRILMNTTRQGWKKQDDALIVNMVNSIGEKWKQISLQIQKFTPKQIRQRYLNYLRPHIDKSEFTFQQDLRICQLVLQQGKHWRKFEEDLPGRTQGAIKSRYYSKLKNIIEYP